MANSNSKSAPIPEPLEKDSVLIAAVGYIVPFVALFGYLIKKNDKYLRIHALQALLFDVAFIIFWTAGAIITVISVVTIVLPFILAPIMMLIALGYLLANIYFAYMTFSHKEFSIPFISEQARKFIE